MVLKENSIFDKRYRLLKKIWEDEEREYWLSHDEMLERDVVLFIVPINSPDVDDSRKGMKLTARLQHPYIIPIYDLQKTDDYLYSVQFYAQNQSILEYMENRENESLKIKEILQLAEQIASAIDFIHSEAVPHKHIRPDVILLDKDKNPYLTEFYVPQNTEELIKKCGIVEYAAPEQFSNDEVDFRCDIYGYGITLYQLFVEELPFPKNKNTPHLSSLGWKQYKDSSVELPSVHSLKSELPIGFDFVLRKLTSKDPDERYKTASDAFDVLNRVYYSANNAIGKVFISYSSENRDYVYDISRELQELGVDIWIDRNGIREGTRWDNSIEDGLNECDKMLLIKTKESMKSEYVTYEWSYFMGLGKSESIYPFIPQEPRPEKIHPCLERIQDFVGTDNIHKDALNIIEVLGKRQKNNKE